MTDKEILKIYETAYKKEFDHYFLLANSFCDRARDKTYAIKFGLGAVGVVYLFRNSSQIEKEITETFEHLYKLGGSIADTVRSIPDIITKHKNIAKEWHETHKNELSVEFKKLLGFIPYKVKQYHLKPSIRMGSPFEDLTTEYEIAEELGKQRAIIDLVAQLKTKYIELGGIEELKIADSTPVPNETLIGLKAAIANNDLTKFFKTVQEVFATMSYDMKITEGYFQSHIHLLLTLLNIKILSELETNIGRIDSVVESENYLHIIEFKKNDCSIALDQIKKKKYYQRFLTTNKKIILVGVAVDSMERNIIDWEMQTYK